MMPGHLKVGGSYTVLPLGCGKPLALAMGRLTRGVPPLKDCLPDYNIYPKVYQGFRKNKIMNQRNLTAIGGLVLPMMCMKHSSMAVILSANVSSQPSTWDGGIGYKGNICFRMASF